MPPLQIRIGINSGVAVVGNVGSAARLNHTALGDAVDVASRPESTNKIYGTGIIGAETRRPAGDRIIVRERDRIAVHGRSAESAIYELIALADEGATPPARVRTHGDGLRFYRSGHFIAATARFQRILEMRRAAIPLCETMMNIDRIDQHCEAELGAG